MSLSLRVQLQQQYADQLGRRYCGYFVASTFTKFAGVPSEAVFLSPYAYCACDSKLGVTGPACNEDKCPTDTQQRICSTNGHPSFGSEYDPNSTLAFTVRDGVPCTVNCVSSTVLCPQNKQQCVPPQGLLGSGFPSVLYQTACSWADACSATAPLRCPDSSCAALPQSRASQQCQMGFTTGVYDAAQFSQVRNLRRCEFPPSTSTTIVCPTDISSGLNASTFNLFAPRPFVWLMLEFNSSTLENQNITVQTNYGPSFQVQITESRVVTTFPFQALIMEKARYVTDPSLGALTLTTDSFLYPLPYLTMQTPLEWSDARLVNVDGVTYVAAHVVPQAPLRVKVEFVAFAASELYVAVSNDQGITFASTQSSGTVSQQACLGNPVLCAFSPTAYPNGTLVLSVRISIKVVLDPIASRQAQPSWYSSQAWMAQFPRTNFSLELDNLPIQFLRAVEVVDASQTQIPCACIPPVVGTTMTTQNRTLEDLAQL